MIKTKAAQTKRQKNKTHYNVIFKAATESPTKQSCNYRSIVAEKGVKSKPSMVQLFHAVVLRSCWTKNAENKNFQKATESGTKKTWNQLTKHPTTKISGSYRATNTQLTSARVLAWACHSRSVVVARWTPEVEDQWQQADRSGPSHRAAHAPQSRTHFPF